MKDDALLALIFSENCVTEEIRQKYFKGIKYSSIRDWLESKGFDRHMPIEFCSAEAAIITPKGMMMQVRPCDADQLGLWGGVVEDGENYVSGLIRELYEELEIKVNPEELKFVEEDQHFHCYQNGDKVKFNTKRYVLELNYVPKARVNPETDGVVFLRPIISHQKQFVEKCVEKYFQN